ncbi:MAG: DUF4115 domain-containing protein [Thioalkalivibrio sp.]|nr:MAG: DUF4115 domain-containing protein [Thioalkalivibrio sp.]
MAERKDKDPVFGRLDDLDDISSLPLGLRNGGPADREPGSGVKTKRREEGSAGPRRDDAPEPGPPVSVVGSLTARTKSSPVEMDEAAPGHPGAGMRHARERAGIDIADLASRTRLSRRIIEALEANRFDAMPPAYVRGYLRTVARELNSDAETWIRSYEGLGYAEPVLKATVQRDGSTRWGLSRGIWGLTVAAILASALGLGVYTWTEGNGAAPMDGVAEWFGETVQRLGGVAPEPLPDADPVPRPAPEPTDELERVPGPEVPDPGVPGPMEEPLSLDPAPAPPEPLLPEPGLPVSPTEPAAPAPEPEPLSEAAPVEPQAPLSEAAPATLEASPEVTAPGPGTGVAVVPTPAPGLSPEPLTVGPAATEPVPGPPAEAAVADERSTLSLAFDGTSWIEIRSAADDVVLQGIFHAGDERSVVVEMPARVILGNAPEVRLSRDGGAVALETHTREDRTARLTLGAD